MRILILGVTGMLGHKMHDVLSQRHDVTGTTRSSPATLQVDARPFFRRGRVLEGVDVTDLAGLRTLVGDLRPETVVNCVGVIKQRDAAHDAATSIAINALLPHQLEDICASQGSRLIHFSTDCVFSGSKGDYSEEDPSDADDLYGRTKYLGEVAGDHALTIRSSIIGRELDHFQSLLEWFLHQRGEVPGFTRAIYTGVTTLQMAVLLDRVLVEQPQLSGVYQVASDKITKFDLLFMIREHFGLHDQIELVPDDAFACDRSLRGDLFSDTTGIAIPKWEDQIAHLAEDAKRYGSVTDG